MVCSKAAGTVATEACHCTRPPRARRDGLFSRGWYAAGRSKRFPARPQGATRVRRTLWGTSQRVSRPRTKAGKRCALAHLGRAGARESVFSDLLVAHFGPGCIGTQCHQFDSNEFLTMRALGPNGVLIQVFEFAFLEPHQFEASRTGFDLRHQQTFQQEPADYSRKDYT